MQDPEADSRTFLIQATQPRPLTLFQLSPTSTIGGRLRTGQDWKSLSTRFAPHVARPTPVKLISAVLIPHDSKIQIFRNTQCMSCAHAQLVCLIFVHFAAAPQFACVNFHLPCYLAPEPLGRIGHSLLSPAPTSLPRLCETGCDSGVHKTKLRLNNKQMRGVFGISGALRAQSFVPARLRTKMVG